MQKLSLVFISLLSTLFLGLICYYLYLKYYPLDNQTKESTSNIVPFETPNVPLNPTEMFYAPYMATVKSISTSEIVLTSLQTKEDIIFTKDHTKVGVFKLNIDTNEKKEESFDFLEVDMTVKVYPLNSKTTQLIFEY